MSKTALQGFMAAAVLSLIGAISVLMQQPLIAPSLASAVLVQVMSPTEPSARPWNTVVGQLVGLAAGLTGVYAAFATTTPIFMGSHTLVWARVLAVVIAIALTVVGETILQASSPAGGATAVVLAIGAETANWAGFGRMVLAIALVTALGEIGRRAMLRYR
jgi:CBS-domain-containing membrane protein